MRVIIAGSRSVTSLKVVSEAIAASGFTITQVVSGGARGVDTLGEIWAKNAGVEVVRFPAEWDRYGRSAGYRRNEVMARHADALVAVWDGSSSGTRHMIEYGRRMGLKVYVHKI